MALLKQKVNGVWETIPLVDSGSSGGTDISLGLTSASVGQIIKVKAVDESGKPTEWEAADVESGGGGGETWELINEITIPDDAEEANALNISTDSNGLPFSLKKAKILAKFPAYAGESNIPTFSFFILNDNYGACYTSGWVTPNKNVARFCSIKVDLSIPGLQSEIVSRNAGTTGIEYFGKAKRESITSIGGTQMLIYPGCCFYLCGVRS